MLVLPIKDSIVYIQPLYLQAQQTAIPELTRVIVVYSDKVVMEKSLQDALLKVFGAQGGSASGGSGGGASGGAGAGTGSSGTATGTAQPTATGDVALAERLYSEAVAAQRAGDWATYGAKIKQLGEVLSRMSSSAKKGGK